MKLFDLPPYGTKITVETDSNLISKWTGRPNDAFGLFSGYLLKNPKWAGVDNICISSNNSSIPFRVISTDIISKISVDGQTIEIKKDIKQNKTFQIDNGKGDYYIITQLGNDFSCTCKGFGFRRNCRHVNEVKEKL